MIEIGGDVSLDILTMFGGGNLGNKLFDDGKIETKILEDYLYSLHKFHDWREKTQKSFDYYMGDQWERGLKSYLKAKKQPAITLNQIIGLVTLVIGHYWINQFDTKVYPIEGGDEVVAEVLSLLIKQIEDSIYGKREIEKAFKEMLISGVGWLDVGMNYDSEPVMGDIMYRRFSTMKVLPDPDSEYDDLGDAKFVIKEINYGKDDLIRHYPKAKRIISEVMLMRKLFSFENESARMGPHHQSKPGGSYEDGIRLPIGLDQKRRPFRVIEYQYREWEEKSLIFDAINGDITEISNDEYSAYEDLIGEEARLVKRYVPTIKTASLLLGENILLEGPVDSPTSTSMFSLVPIFGYESLNRRFGLVENLKDPQDERNKRRSQILHIINQTPGVGITMTENAISKDMQRKFENEGIPDGAFVIIKQGARFEERKQRMLPAATYQMELSAKDDIFEISLLNKDLAGLKEDRTASGRAISLRHRQGAIGIQGLIENLRFGKRQLVKLAIELIQNNYTLPKMVRILGKEVGINQIVKQGDIYRILNDVTLGKYDVTIAEGESTPTARLAKFEEVMRMFDSRMVEGMSPEKAQVLIDAAIELSDLPEEAKRRFQAAAQMSPLGGGEGAGGGGLEQLLGRLGGKPGGGGGGQAKPPLPPQLRAPAQEAQMFPPGAA